MRIGLLLPSSSTHPNIPINFRAGLEAALQSQIKKNQIEIFTSSIGFGIDKMLLLDTAQTMFVDNGVEVVVVFADEPNVEILYPLAAELEKQLIVVNHGAKFNTAQKMDFVTYHSLDMVISAYLSGCDAKQIGDEAVMVTSLYDGPYSVMQAMVDGFLVKPDGLAASFVLKHTVENFDTSDLSTYLAENQKPLLCALSGSLVDEFFKQMQDLPQAGNINIIASSVLIEEILLLDRNLSFPVSGYTSWHAGINTNENLALISAFEMQNRKADAVAALGWDTGLILLHLINQGAAGNEHFKGVVIESAKGSIRFDPDTNRFLSSQYLATAGPGENLIFSQEINPEVSFTAWNNITTAYPKGTDIGWVNTYLCS